MLRAVIDTNILINHFSGIERFEVEERDYAISALSIFELFRLPGMSPTELERLTNFVFLFERFSVTEEIAKRAALLSTTRSDKRVVDLIIAATALELGLPLVTKNIKDFRQIPDLQIQPAP